METKKATLADLSLLAKWNKEMIADQGHRNPMNVDELEDRMKNWLENESYIAHIFYDRSSPVAYSLYREEANEVFLRQFYVCRDFRRQGIGTRAMEILLKDIWPNDKRLIVEVLLTNKPAIEFWKAVGYREHYLGLEILPEER